MTAPGQTSLFGPESSPDPLLCWLWLAHTLGPANSHAGSVLDAFGGAQQAWEARETAAFRQAAGASAAHRAVKSGKTPDDYAGLVMTCDALQVHIITYDSPDYPLAFTRIPDMPLVLYCTGDPVWLNEPDMVGIVGSRKPTAYGAQAAADLGGALARGGAVIVSGLADGLDSAGHRAAVQEQRPTIAVMAVPIDRTYPAANTRTATATRCFRCRAAFIPPTLRARIACCLRAGQRPPAGQRICLPRWVFPRTRGKNPPSGPAYRSL